MSDTLSARCCPIRFGPGTWVTFDVELIVPPLPGGEYMLVDLVDELICWCSDVSGRAPRQHHLSVT